MMMMLRVRKGSLKSLKIEYVKVKPSKKKPSTLICDVTIFVGMVKLEGRCHKIQKHPRGDDFFNFDLKVLDKVRGFENFVFGLISFRKKL